MYISRVKIKNFKCFKETFTLELNEGLNILVGNNETGKSTILEAIHLALSGLYNGRYARNELSEYFFNNKAVEEFKAALNNNKPILPPEILIEVFIAGENLPFFEGDGNSENKKECGVCLKIAIHDKHKADYEDFVNAGEVTSLPIEFYELDWTSCARDPITPRRIPIKSALIDSSSNRYQNGSDVYIAHIIKTLLNERQKNGLAQAHRKLQTTFTKDEEVIGVNKVIADLSQKSKADKTVKLSIDLSSKNAWEHSFLTYVEDIPFHHIGKGEQAIIKTKLALEHKKAKEANIILLEEPENHLSHTKLNQLIKEIELKCQEKQILISTHSSFVANKLGLENLILLNDKKTIRLNQLSKETYEFFQKIPGYNTLRLILCKKAILVEGDSDELIVQKAYRLKHNNRLPIEDEIDVISVGTSFLRFLEIAEKVSKPVVIVTDNDGKVSSLKIKYKNYLEPNKKAEINICFDPIEDPGTIDAFNYNTLEPKFVKANNVALLNQVLGKNFTENELHLYMYENKTSCALKIFDTDLPIEFPDYIVRAINE